MKFTLGSFHFRIHPSGLDAKNLELQLPLIPNNLKMICHANISFGLHFVAHG